MSTTATPMKTMQFKYEKGLSRPKDSNAPKKPLSAYFQWAGENRSRVQEEMDNAKLAEVTKKMGTMWRSLPKDEKESWEEKAKTEMEAYKEKLDTYKKTSQHSKYEMELREYQIKMTYKPFDKDENTPKRPLSAYMLFAEEERLKIIQTQNLKFADVMVLVAKAWKELGVYEKQPYMDKANKLSEEYKKQVEAYKETPEYNKYVAEKEAYKLRMAAKRRRLMKQAGIETPKKTAKKKAAPQRRKKTTPKKKTSKNKKKAVKRTKVSSKKRRRSASKTSAKKTSSSKKKKVSKSKKKSATKKAKKARTVSASSKK